MKRIGVGKSLSRTVERKLLGHLLAMVLYPVPKFVRGSYRIPIEHHPTVTCARIVVPLEEATADDLRGFGFRRHYDRLANALKHLFETLVVGLVVGAHFEFRSWDGYRQHHVVAPAGLFAEVVKKAVELASHAAFSAATDKIHQLVHQDQYWLVFGEKCTNYIATRCDLLLLMFGENCECFLSADLKGDFAPGRSPHRSSVRTSSTRNWIEFRADKCCNLSGRDRVDSGDLKQPGNAMPILCFRAVIR